jgi:ATP-dependent Clp protease protease subunit
VNQKSLQKLHIQIQKITAKYRERFADLTNLDIFLHINSNGGSLHCGLAMYDIVKNSEIPITGIIEGTAASAATLLFLGCAYKQMTKNSLFLIHQLSSGFWGTHDEFTTEKKNMDQEMKMLTDIYVFHGNKSEKKIRKFLKKDVWWTSSQCLKYEFIDEIL